LGNSGLHNNARINELRVAIAQYIDPVLEGDWTAEELTVAFLQLSAAAIMAMEGDSSSKFRWGIKRLTEFCEFYSGDLHVDMQVFHGGEMSGVVN
jgi:hypothetical protein